MTSKSEQQHLDAIHEMPCIIGGMCGGRLEAHHITRGGRRIDHYHTLPLCTYHHGPQTPLPLGEAIHKGKKLFEAKYGSQMELLKKVRNECPCSACSENRKTNQGE